MITVILVAILVFVLLYGPIFVPIASSFFALKQGVVDWQQPTASAYVTLVSNEGILIALRPRLRGSRCPA